MNKELKAMLAQMQATAREMVQEKPYVFEPAQSNIDEKLELKNQHLTALSEAKKAGLPAAAIPLADLLETGAGSADFDWAFWERSIKFRCSALGSLMTNKVGKTRAQKIEECETRLAKLQQEYIDLREKDQSKFDEKIAEYLGKINTAKTPAAREKAEDKLRDFRYIGLVPSAAYKLKGMQLDKAQKEFEQTNFEQECTLSETAKSLCKNLFYTAFFKARPELHGAALEHGLKYENYCIERYGLVANLDLSKNDLRQTLAVETESGGTFLTGEADNIWEELDADGRKIIREFKAPFDCQSYGKQVEEYKANYFWQCQGYIYLYGADAVDLVASLTENDYMDGREYSHLPSVALHGVFRIEKSQKHIDKMLAKLSEAHAYTLNFGREFVAQIGKTRSIPAPELD
jgi:hypothetical protein